MIQNERFGAGILCPSLGLFELIQFDSGIFPSLCYLFHMSGSQQVGTTKQVAVNSSCCFPIGFPLNTELGKGKGCSSRK